MNTLPLEGNPRPEVGPSEEARNSRPAREPLSPHERRQVRRYLRVIRAGDPLIAVLVLLGGFLIANLDRMPVGLQGFLGLRLTVKNLLLVAGFIVAWRLIGILFGLYDEQRLARRPVSPARVLAAVTAGAAVSLVLPLISVTHAFRHLAIFYYWVGSAVALVLFRAGVSAVLRRKSSQTRDVVIVGSGPRALDLYHGLCGDRGRGYRCLGFVDSAGRELAPEVRSRMLSDLGGLERILMRQAIDEVLIALPARSCYAEIQQTIEICERGGVPARYLADVFQHRRSGNRRLAIESLTSVPAGVSPDDGRLLVKRLLDLALGGLALAIVSPVLAGAAIAIKLGSPGPVFFAQERYGLNKRRFKMFKLRTMIVDAEAQQVHLEGRNEATGPVFKIRDDPRITPVGRILRRLSIDELPQLLNVIRGEMSLVGPRPLPMRDVSRFLEPALMRRFSVCPGVTGLWQISGRSELEFDHLIQLDLRYIDEWSLGLDLRILVLTLPAVVRGVGAV